MARGPPNSTWSAGTRRTSNPPGNDAGASTARGVMAGLRAVCGHLELQPDRSTFAVQGMGSVGLAVAEQLVRLGAKVVVSDVRPHMLQRARDLGAVSVDVDAVLATACDVFVPCAIGGVLDEAAVKAIQAKAICGSANNQLARAELAQVLAERRVVFVPDVVVSAGAVIEGVLTVQQGRGPAVREQIAAAIDAIEGTTAQLLQAAAKLERPPLEIALQWAEERLATTPG